MLRLRCMHIEIKNAYLVVKASHCKTEMTNGLPEGVLSLSQCPAIESFLRSYVQTRKTTGAHRLFDIPSEGSLALWFNERLVQLLHELGI